MYKMFSKITTYFVIFPSCQRPACLLNQLVGVQVVVQHKLHNCNLFVGKMGYAPILTDFQSVTSTKLVSTPFALHVGLEPTITD